jgi:hypothetical protein
MGNRHGWRHLGSRHKVKRGAATVRMMSPFARHGHELPIAARPPHRPRSSTILSSHGSRLDRADMRLLGPLGPLGSRACAFAKPLGAHKVPSPSRIRSPAAVAPCFLRPLPQETFSSSSVTPVTVIAHIISEHTLLRWPRSAWRMRPMQLQQRREAWALSNKDSARMVGLCTRESASQLAWRGTTSLTPTQSCHRLRKSCTRSIGALLPSPGSASPLHSSSSVSALHTMARPP